MTRLLIRKGLSRYNFEFVHFAKFIYFIVFQDNIKICKDKDNGSMDDLIKTYFIYGYTYNEILEVLQQVHGISMSIRKLHRILRGYGLYRKSNQSSFNTAINFIGNQLSGSGSCIGYRQMHQRCIINNFRISRHNVLTIMQLLDPDGIHLRKRNRLRRRKCNL